MSQTSQRTLKRSGIQKAIWRTVNQAHVALYRRGLARRMGKAKVVLLTTTGRKSGKRITSPLNAGRDGENFIVIASAGGADWHPSWWLNLKANPNATVQLDNETIPVRMEEITDPIEKQRLWKKMTETYPGYDNYTKKTSRVIPLGILRPVR
jgi:deazaflavin-dependent oxidoreductase (nitroreductase family)